MKTRIILLSILVLVSLSSLVANTDIIYVNPSAQGLNDGTNWQNAYTDLQNALQTATQGDSVWVTMGTYYPTDGTDRNISFEIPNKVSLFGGFRGDEERIDQRPDSTQSTLSGDIAEEGFHTDNTNNVLYFNNPTGVTTIDGFIIRDGYSLGTFADPRQGRIGNGGGMYIYGREGASYIRINNCQFINNQATLSGGAIYLRNYSRECEGMAIRVTNSTFENNQAVLNGGAISLEEKGNETYISFITNCSFKKNIGRQSGGAIYLYDNNNCGEFYIITNEFIENEAAIGGAINHTDQHFTGGININKCLFKRNKGRGLGGAINHVGRDTTQTTFIDNSQFIENSCGIPNGSGTGGAIVFENPIYEIEETSIPAVHHTFSNNTFIANTSTRGGGAMYTGVISVTLSNCIFVDNSSGRISGGGAVSLTTTLIRAVHPHEFSHCLFLANHTSAAGGAIEIRARGIQTKFSNSIFANNYANTYDLIAPFNANLEFDHCLFQDFDSCADIPNIEGYHVDCLDTENLFRGIPIFTNAAKHNYRLDFCSPGINRGQEDGISEVDFDGNPRIANGRPDIGPYEIQDFPDIELLDYTVIPTCKQSATGNISFEFMEICPPISYAWTNEEGETGTNIDSLESGIYTFIITDSILAKSLEVAIEIPVAAPITTNFEIVGASDMNTPDGAIIVQTIQGGVPPYEIEIDGVVQEESTILLKSGDYTLSIRDRNNCVQTFHFTIPFITNVDEYKNSIPPKIFPSPVGHEEWVQLYIPKTSLSKITIRILDTQGRVVKRETINRTNGQYWQFPPPKAAGLYFVEVQLEGLLEVLKLVKQK